MNLDFKKHLVFWARKPKTKSMESMTLDLPLPLGPTMLVKLLWKGPSTWAGVRGLASDISRVSRMSSIHP